MQVVNHNEANKDQNLTQEPNNQGKINKTQTQTQTQSQSQDKVEISKLIEELKLCQQQRDEFKEGWQRERANFENFQKNLQNIFKEQSMLIQRKLIDDILDVVDSFYLALSQIPQEKKDDPFINGIYQIKARLDNFLKKNNVDQYGLEDKFFNPKLHEAIAVEKTNIKEDDNKIIKVVSLGFKLNDIVIRPAKVVTAKYEQ
jgi:molecular chaperone GrpE